MASNCTLAGQNIQIALDSKNFLAFEEFVKQLFHKRDIVLSRLRKKEHLQIIVDGWIVHYNYFKKHELLNGRTPAKKAAVSITTPN